MRLEMREALMPMGVRHHPMTCCSLDSTDTATMNREWCASSTRSVQPAVPTTRITPTPTETATSIAIPTAIPLPTHPSSPTTSHSAAHIRAHTSAATTGIPTDAPSASANMSAARSAPKWCACCNRRYSSVSARC